METLMETGCIKSSSSPYPSSSVLVCNKSGDPHVCVDYRAVNN